MCAGTGRVRDDPFGFTNGYDFGYFSLVVPSGSPITGFDELTAAQRIGVVQGTVQEAYVVDTLGLDPVKFPDYNTVYASLKSRQIDAWVAPSQQAQGTIQPGDPTQIIENTFSLDNFVAYAVATENTPLIDALNSGLDAVIADGTRSAADAVVFMDHGVVVESGHRSACSTVPKPIACASSCPRSCDRPSNVLTHAVRCGRPPFQANSGYVELVTACDRLD